MHLKGKWIVKLMLWVFCPIQVTGRGPVGIKKQSYLKMSHCRFPIKNLYWDAATQGRCHVLWGASEAPVFLWVDFFHWRGHPLWSEGGHACQSLGGSKQVLREWRTPVWNSGDCPSTNPMTGLCGLSTVEGGIWARGPAGPATEWRLLPSQRLFAVESLPLTLQTPCKHNL